MGGSFCLLGLMDDNNSPKLRTSILTEAIELREAELDTERFIAAGAALIRPGFSENVDKAGRSRYYSPRVLESAVSVFEGARAFANHPRRSDSKELPERDIKDIVGYYKNVRMGEGGRLFADFHVVGMARQWLWPLIQETKVKPDLIELSINAVGRTTLGKVDGREAVMVEAILKSKHNSIDVVTTGAAGGTLDGALIHSDGDGLMRDLLQAMSFEEWREARADYVEKLKGEWKTARDEKALKEAKDKAKELKETITQLENDKRALEGEMVKYRRAESADRLLAESALPARIKQAIRAELLECQTDEDAAKKLAIETDKFNAMPKPPVNVQTGTPVPVTETQRRLVVSNPVMESLGINPNLTPRDGETPEQWKRRISRKE